MIPLESARRDNPGAGRCEHFLALSDEPVSQLQLPLLDWLEQLTIDVRFFEDDSMTSAVEGPDHIVVPQSVHVHVPIARKAVPFFL